MSEFELIEREAASMLDLAREVVVESDEQYAEVGEFVLGCKQLIAKIKAEFAEPKRKADEAHKSITAMEKRTIEPVQRALDMASVVALEYKRGQDRLAKEEAEKVAQERRHQEEEKRLAEAAQLEAQGKAEEAEAVIAAPIQTPRSTRFITPVPKVAGLSSRKKWKAKIIDPKAVNREYCQPWELAINAKVGNYFSWIKAPTAEQIKALEAEIGGVEIYEEEVFAGRVRG
jgi:hypothetical protein